MSIGVWLGKERESIPWIMAWKGERVITIELCPLFLVKSLAYKNIPIKRTKHNSSRTSVITTISYILSMRASKTVENLK